MQPHNIKGPGLGLGNDNNPNERRTTLLLLIIAGVLLGAIAVNLIRRMM